jgi:glycosyltransferase involved in cell wall biosynthesis
MQSETDPAVTHNGASDAAAGPAALPGAPVTVLILTYNEEQHLARAIESVRLFAGQVVVVDSFSTDRTVEIARALGATVLQNRWENNHARQFNWGLDHAPIAGQWVMRLDADEYATPELAQEIARRLAGLPAGVNGVYVKRRIHFLGRWIRYGAVYPMWVLRLWRTGHGRCENRWMDEHIRLTGGESLRFAHDLVDENLNDLTWWTDKHNRYAVREAADLLNLKYRFADFDALDTMAGREQSKIKRWLKERVYARLPLFVRPAGYFVYRYFLRLGFLDGVPGLVWHALQGFWYRFLVDAKVYEAERRSGGEREAVLDLVQKQWGLK